MAARQPRDYFVIMPFGTGTQATEWRRRFERIIKPAVDRHEHGRRRSRRYVCQLMSMQKKSGSIPDALARRLFTADIVIADLTTANGNVLYELGVRHTGRSGTILIAEQKSPKPFDLRTEQIITYDPQAPAQAIDDIASAIAECENDPGHPDSPPLRARLAIEEPAVYARWRQRNGRYRAPIDGLWVERVDRGTPSARDIHFSVFDFRFHPGLLHPFEMQGSSFSASGRLHSTWKTKYVRIKRSEDRRIVIEYVYSARRNGLDRPGYGQCVFLADHSGRFTTGGGFYLAGEEQPPRRRNYELHRLDKALLQRLGLERLTVGESSLSKIISRFTRVLGTGPLHFTPAFHPIARSTPRPRVTAGARR